jgi:hypothetical protein
MCRAFLDIYSCDFDRRHKLENLGLTGVGFAWQDLASAVEDAARYEAFMRLDVRLNRDELLEEELISSECKVPVVLMGKWFPKNAFPLKGAEEIKYRDRAWRRLAKYIK